MADDARAVSMRVGIGSGSFDDGMGTFKGSLSGGFIVLEQVVAQQQGDVQQFFAQRPHLVDQRA
ncbi:hypothetical protein ACQV5M_19425, partial [Leptospira sp. SA-E8]|uniref:hypothetical protein n=1 Tax=Leptospira sp. SA-E8 TaxID=3422259 RepID=UPI003EBD960D